MVVYLRVRNVSTDRSSRSNITEELGHQLGERLSTAVVLFHSAVAERLGLNVTDWKCASILWREGPCNPSRLAEITGMSTAATTQVIDRLERAGIVRRERDPHDRRKVVLQPVANPEFSARVQEVLAGLVRAMTDVMAGYTLDQLATILDFVEKTSLVLERETVRLRRPDGMMR